jgi:hypothetical protein
VAVFIAVMTMLQEYQKPARPWSIFMRALALPGLVIGSWHSLADNSRLRDADKELHAAELVGRESSGITLIATDAPAEAPIVRRKTSGLTPDTRIRYASLLPPDLFRAASSLTLSSPLIVVDRRPDSTSAATRAQELRSTCCPGASWLHERPGGGWYVLESTASRTHTEALRRAIAIREKCSELKPQLLAVEK